MKETTLAVSENHVVSFHNNNIFKTYRNITDSTTRRLSLLSHKSDMKVTMLLLPSDLTVYISRKDS